MASQTFWSFCRRKFYNHCVIKIVKCLNLQKNATADGTLEAKTGLKERDDLGQIVKFNGKDKLPWWSGDKCNELKSDFLNEYYCVGHNDSLFLGEPMALLTHLI